MIAGGDTASVRANESRSGELVATLSKAERTDLQKVARLRARVARNQIATREAELVAQMESELSAIYPPNDPRWAEIAKAADAAVQSADEKVAAICEEMGIPAEFRPGLHIGWHSRGENATASRRAELRRLGAAQIQAAGKLAKSTIDRAELAALTEIIADGLTSEAAQRFLAAIPTPDELMAAPAVSELERARTQDDAARTESRMTSRMLGGGSYV